MGEVGVFAGGRQGGGVRGGQEDTREGNSKCKGPEVGMSQWSLSS